ncbi:MAG: hypothetical protein HUK07_06510 [Bacteroidaceae bacterium]|nr:hypothetical protein [Bacteroidaceae bacterium]
MKKLNILSYLAAAALFVACSDGENSVQVSDFHIVKSQTSIDAEGGEAFVDMDKAVANAYIDANWASVTVEGLKVRVSAKALTETNESRAAKLVIKDNLNDSVIVGIKQFAPTMAQFTDTVFVSSDSPTEINYGVPHTGVITYKAPSWIQVEETEEGLNLSLSENKEGHIRKGQVVLYSGKLSSTVEVIQADFAQDIAGNYDVTYTDATGKDVTTTATLSTTNLILDNYPKISIPISVGSILSALVQSNGVKLGTVSDGGTKHLYITCYEGDTWCGCVKTKAALLTFDYTTDEQTVGCFNTTKNGVTAFAVSEFKAPQFVSSRYDKDYIYVSNLRMIKK